MKRMKVTCGNCAGIGYTINWKVVSEDAEGVGTMQKEEIVCGNCNGKGYTEYATFTVEEAKAILKHCGLTTEN